MTTIYVWGADVHCEDCYLAGKLDGSDCDGNEAEGYDADYQESDTPLHCRTCGEHIPGPLTAYGRAYVTHAVALALRPSARAASLALEVWAPEYGVRTDSYTTEELTDALLDGSRHVDLPQGYRVTDHGPLGWSVADTASTPWHESPPVVLLVPTTPEQALAWLVSRGLLVSD